MSNKKISTAFVVIVAAAILVTLAFKVRIGATADSIAVLRTTGMTCGSCSSRITKELQGLKGVAVTEVDVEGGWVVVGYSAKDTKPEILVEKVRGAGFGSNVQALLTPEQFKQITGRDIGKKASLAGGCGSCGTSGGCGSKK